jgi:serine/threonine protein kinase
MIAEQQHVLEEICLRALETDPGERTAFLRAACPDEQMRVEVESLLAAADYADALFKAPPALIAGGEQGSSEEGASPGIGPEIGEAIGPYRLMERLGEGGMGVVCRASQREPVRREVALKIIRPGMDSALVAARFGAERQALSLMDHPNIARVVDAGTTRSDRAYFVMELVRGEPVNRYCDVRRLSVRRRVELMVPVCQAIQHAHQRGVIHRDIKPSNILVADGPDGPVPKVIDFGIAKATETPLHEGATFTRAFDVVGTLEYMSPEQADPGGRGVDVRSDVYSLGAVLYELLTGTPPIAGLSLRESGFTSILKRIHEEIPPAPSQRVRDDRALGAQLAGECDWIALKALEKDRERRYESAGAMARDLERYLTGDAVEASPPSRTYRLRKFAGRHRSAFIGAIAFVGVLVAAVIWMSVALRQQMRANANAAALREVVRKVMIERPAQLAQLPNSLKLRSDLMSDVEGALDALSKDVGHDRTADLELARAYYAVANVRGNVDSDGSMGELEAALKYFERSGGVASGLIRSHPEDRDAQRMFLSSRLAILYIYRRRERFADAEKVAREIAARAQALPAWMHRQEFFVDYDISAAYKEIAAMKTSQGMLEEALALNRSALSAFTANLQEKWLKLPMAKNNLAACYADTGLSEWRIHGYSDEASRLLHRGLAAVEGCTELMCRSRAAELEGSAGLVDWSGGREKEGLELLERGIHDMETLAAADAAEVIFKGVAQSLRRSHALALVASHRAGQALNVLRSYFKPGDPAAQTEDLLVYGQVVEAVGASESGEPYLDAARQSLDKERRTGFEPQVMRWAMSRTLADRADRLKQHEEAIRLRREALRLAEELPADRNTVRIFTSGSAAAFARTVAGMRNAPEALRMEASRLLDGCCEGVPRPYRVEHAGTIVSTPAAQEIVELKAALAVP